MASFSKPAFERGLPMDWIDCEKFLFVVPHYSMVQTDMVQRIAKF